MLGFLRRVMTRRRVIVIVIVGPAILPEPPASLRHLRDERGTFGVAGSLAPLTHMPSPQMWPDSLVYAA